MHDHKQAEIRIGARVKLVNIEPHMMKRAWKMDKHAMGEVIGFVHDDRVGQVCMVKFPGRNVYIKVAPQYVHVCKDDQEVSGITYHELMDHLNR